MEKIAGYEFGPYLIEVETARLWYEGVPIGLKQRQFELLLLLIGKAGEVVSKESILDAVWPDTVVEESNLPQQIHHLRRLLNDTTNNSQYILTVPGRGYLFLHQVRPVFGAALEQFLALSAQAVLSDDPALAEEGEGKIPGPLPENLSGPRLLPKSFLPYWRQHPGSIILVLLAVMVAGGLLALVFNVSGGRALRQLKVRKSIPVSGSRISPDISPDGRMIAFSGLGETRENEDIYLSAMDGDQLRRVTNHADADCLPVWSPDGQRLAFIRYPNRDGGEGRVIIIAPLAVLEGLEEDLGPAEDGLAWTPDGRHLVVTDHEEGLPGSALYQISIETRERRRLTNPDRMGTSDRMPRFSSDGGQLAFVRWRSRSSADIQLLDLASGEMAQVTSDHRPITDLQWGLRGGGFYYVTNRTGMSRLWHVFIHSRNVRQVHQFPIEISSFDITNEGIRLVYSRQIEEHQTEIVEIGPGDNGDDSGRKPFSCLLDSSGVDGSPVFSPDGRAVAFVSERSGTPEIWTANADCKQLTRVTRLNGLEIGRPGWSPDGTRLVFDWTVDGQSELFTVTADGRDIQRLTRNDQDEILPTWAPDGRWIYYQQGSRIERIPATGGEAVTAVTGGAGHPAVSPDGSILYFTRADILWRRDLRSGKEEVLQSLRDIPVARSWQVTAGGIYFVATAVASGGDNEIDRSPRVKVERLDLKTGKVDLVKWLEGKSPRDASGLSVSPDARRMAFAFHRTFRGELAVVEGWRLNPISQYLIDLFHLEQLLVHTSHDPFTPGRH